MQDSRIAGMLKTLIDTGNINIDDIVCALNEIREDNEMTNIPQIQHDRVRNRYYIMMPARLSPTGKRKPVYGKTEDEVKENYLLATRSVAEEKVPTLSEYTIYVLQAYKLGVKEDTTYDKYESLWRNHINKHPMGSVKINKITSADLTRYFAEKANGKYSEQLVKGLKTILNNTFKRAKEHKLVEDNWMDYVEVSYKNCKKPKKKEEKPVYTLEDLEAIEGVIMGQGSNRPKRYFYSPIFMFMALSGLRIGEAMALTWSDIDFNNKLIYVNKQYVEGYKRDINGKKKGKKYYTKPPKSESGIREVILLEKAEFWIKEMRRRQKVIGLRSELVFCNKKGKTPTKSNAYEMLNKVIRDSGVDYATSHKFRKLFVSEAINVGIPLAKVSGMAGHKDSTTTLNSYYKVTNTDSNTDARNTLNRLYN